MYIAWTTTDSRREAESLAETAVYHGFAACAQIEGPMTSIYTWKNQMQSSQEFRITFKALDVHLKSLESLIHRHHSYEVPEWVVLKLEEVGTGYLAWAQNVSDLRAKA